MIGPIALFLVAASGSAPIPALTPERVQEAIEYGKVAGDRELAQYPLHDEETWLANFDTPFLRVAQLAAALRKDDKPLEPKDLPVEFAAGQVHVYVHAKDDGERAPRSVSYVALVEPGQEGHVESVIPPVSSSSYVRRVPTQGSRAALARIARSMKAVFPLALFVPGNRLRVSFDDGATETVALDAKMFAGVR